MNEMARQAATVLFGKGLIRISQLVAFVVIARFLTTAEFGWFGIVSTSVTLAATLGSLGLRQSLAYSIGQQKILPKEAAATALVIWPILALASAGVVWLLLEPDAPRDNSLFFAVAVGASVVFAILVMLLQGVSLGLGQIRQFTTTDTVPKVVLMAIAIALALMGAMNLMSSLWAQAAGFIIAAPIALNFALRGPGRFRPRLRLIPGMLQYGLVFALNLFLITLCSRLSMFVIQNYFGAASAGEFYAASRANEIFLEAATAVGMVLFSRAARSDDQRGVVGASARLSAWMLWFFLLLAVGVALCAPMIVHILLGAQYAGAVGALQILAFGLAPAAASKIIYPTIAGTGRPYFGTPVIIASLLINLGLAYLLVPSTGVIGGAVAVLLGQICLYVGYALTAVVKYRLPLCDFFVPRSGDLKRIWAAIRRRLRIRRSGPPKNDGDADEQ